MQFLTRIITSIGLEKESINKIETSLQRKSLNSNVCQYHTESDVFVKYLLFETVNVLLNLTS